MNTAAVIDLNFVIDTASNQYLRAGQQQQHNSISALIPPLYHATNQHWPAELQRQLQGCIPSHGGHHQAQSYPQMPLDDGPTMVKPQGLTLPNTARAPSSSTRSRQPSSKPPQPPMLSHYSYVLARGQHRLLSPPPHLPLIRPSADTPGRCRRCQTLHSEAKLSAGMLVWG